MTDTQRARPFHDTIESVPCTASAVTTISSGKEDTRFKAVNGIFPYYQDNWQPWTPRPTCPSGDSTHQHDIAIGIETKSKNASIGSFFTWLWDCITGSESAKKAEEVADAEPTSSQKRKPRLPRPDIEEGNLQNMLAKMNQSMKRIEELESDTRDFLKDKQHFSDNVILRGLIEGLQQQKASRAESAVITQERLFKEQEVKRNLHKKLHELLVEGQNNAAKVSTTSWFGSVLDWGIVGLGVLGVVAGVVTGGMALPFILASSGSMIAQGVNQGFKGYYETKGNKLASEFYGIKEEKSESHRKIQNWLDDLKQSQQYVNQCHGLHGQVVRALSEASTYRQ